MFLVLFQEIKRQGGKLSFSYEAEVAEWSIAGFSFSYAVRPWTIGCLWRIDQCLLHEVMELIKMKTCKVNLHLKLYCSFLLVTFLVVCSCNLHLFVILKKEKCFAYVYSLVATRLGRFVTINIYFSFFLFTPFFFNKTGV